MKGQKFANHLDKINHLLHLINDTNTMSKIEINNTNTMSSKIEINNTMSNVKISNSYNNIKIYSNNILGQILEINNQLSRNMEGRRGNESSLKFSNESLLEDEIAVKDRQLLSSLQEFGETKNQEDHL